MHTVKMKNAMKFPFLDYILHHSSCPQICYNPGPGPLRRVHGQFITFTLWFSVELMTTNGVIPLSIYNVSHNPTNPYKQSDAAQVDVGLCEVAMHHHDLH